MNKITLITILFYFYSSIIWCQSLNSAEAIAIAGEIKRSTSFEALEIISVTNKLRLKGFNLVSITHLDIPVQGAIKKRVEDNHTYENVNNSNEVIIVNTIGTTTDLSDISYTKIYFKTDNFDHYMQWMKEIENNLNFAKVFANNLKPTEIVFNYKPGQASIYRKIIFTTAIETSTSLLWKVKKPIIYEMIMLEMHD